VSKPRFLFGFIVLLCIHCAYRIGEASALKWSYITPEHIVIPKEITKNGRQQSQDCSAHKHLRRRTR
jgi:integrase